MNTDNYLTISEFTKILKNNIESNYPHVMLKGEVSNYRPSSTGHWYFSLKDQAASIRAIIFRNNQQSIIRMMQSYKVNSVKDGLAVMIEGRISLYERSGDYSIIINKMIPLGIGELALKFQELKEKLSKEGLFDPSKKKPLPKYPAHIGIVTSPTAAALKDILNVISRRFSSVKITVFPATVQGENAKNEIVKAIKYADYHYRYNTKYKVDTLILARGGGSIEDLWPFNEEIVAYAIYSATVPIISGIGHEIDYTIADFCADLRAPTPSAAAEIVVKNSEDLINSITSYKLRIEVAFNNYIQRIFYKFNPCKKERLINLFERRYQDCLQDFANIEDRLKISYDNYYKFLKQKFTNIVQKLNDLSPLNTLSRGYSVVLNEQGNIIRTNKQVKKDDQISIILEKGEIKATVNDTSENWQQLKL